MPTTTKDFTGNDGLVTHVTPLGTPRTRRLLRSVTLRTQKAERGKRRGLAGSFARPKPLESGERDRSLAGKARIRARKAARRA